MTSTVRRYGCVPTARVGTFAAILNTRITRGRAGGRATTEVARRQLIRFLSRARPRKSAGAVTRARARVEYPRCVTVVNHARKRTRRRTSTTAPQYSGRHMPVNGRPVRNAGHVRRVFTVRGPRDKGPPRCLDRSTPDNYIE